MHLVSDVFGDLCGHYTFDQFGGGAVHDDLGVRMVVLAQVLDQRTARLLELGTLTLLEFGEALGLVGVVGNGLCGHGMILISCVSRGRPVDALSFFAGAYGSFFFLEVPNKLIAPLNLYLYQILSKAPAF